MEVGIDIAIEGAFTGIVGRGDDGRVRIAKLPRTHGDRSRAGRSALDMARTEWGVPPPAISRFAHGTTAVLERQAA